MNLVSPLIALLLSAATASPGVENDDANRVQVHDHTAFRVRVGRGEVSPAERARRASEALRQVIADKLEGDASFQVLDGEAHFSVGGRTLFVLTPADAQAEGEPSLERFAQQRKEALDGFLKAERRRASLQNATLAICLAIFLAFTSFLLMRQLRRWAARAHRYVSASEEAAPAEGLRAVLRDEKMRWLAVLLVHGAHVFAQVGVFYLFLVAVFSLFERTQAWRGQLARWALAPMVSLAERLSSGIPTLLLFFLLFVMVQAGWHAINITTERMASGRAQIANLPRHMATSARLLMRLGLILAALLVFAPLLTGDSATLFSDVGLRLLEVIGLAILPVVAALVAGLVSLFSRQYSPGDWVLAPNGEPARVEAVELFHVRLVLQDGNQLLVPHLWGLVKPLKHLAHAPPLEVEIPVASLVEPTLALESLRTAGQAFAESHGASGGFEVELVALHPTHALFRARIPGAAAHLRSALLVALSTSLAPEALLRQARAS